VICVAFCESIVFLYVLTCGVTAFSSHPAWNGMCVGVAACRNRPKSPQATKQTPKNALNQEKETSKA
jgi:hypothetical protein